MASKPPDNEDYKKLFGESDDPADKPHNTPAPIRETRRKAKPLFETEEENLAEGADRPIPSIPKNPTPSPTASSRVSRKDREAAVTSEEKELYRDIFGTEADIETVDPDGRESLSSYTSTTALKKKDGILQGEEQADLIYSQTSLPKLEKVASATSSVAMDWKNAKRSSAYLLVKRIPLWMRFVMVSVVMFFAVKYLYELRFTFVDLEGNDQELNILDYGYESLTMSSYHRKLQNTPRALRPVVITEGRMRLLYAEGLSYINATKRYPTTPKDLEEAGFNVRTFDSDGWRNELRFETDGEDLVVRSPGEDSKFRNGDDFTFGVSGFISMREKLKAAQEPF